MAWQSGATWFDALMDALGTGEGERRRRRARVARDTLLAIARADWLSADARTGRGVATAHETVAAQLGCCPKTVQRARALLEALGFSVTVVPGRYLTTAERAEAAAQHGGRQLRAASVRALTMPRPASRAVENVQLPRRGSDLSNSHLLEYSPTRAEAHEEAAPRPASTRKVSRRPRRSAADPAPRSIAVQRLAAGLVDRMPWLGRGRHIGQVCGMLERSAVDAETWTVDDVLDAIEQANRAVGRVVVDPATQRDPVAYLGWMLRRSVDPSGSTPAVERARRRAADEAEREARRERHRAEAAELEELRRQQLTPEWQAARAAFFAIGRESRRARR